MTTKNVATTFAKPGTKIQVDVPAGIDAAKVTKALKFYQARMDYQEVHNKARRLAMQALSKKYPVEYKDLLKHFTGIAEAARA